MYTPTLSLERVVFLDGDEFGQHAAQPLRVDEVEVVEETAVLIVKQNTTVMEEASRLVNVRLLDLVRVVRISDGLAADQNTDIYSCLYYKKHEIHIQCSPQAV